MKEDIKLYGKATEKQKEFLKEYYSSFLEEDSEYYKEKVAELENLTKQEASFMIKGIIQIENDLVGEDIY